jgi:hypothetical protein
MIDKQKLVDASAEEMLKHRHQKILLNISLPDALILVAQLQLAIRHPENPAAGTTRAYCESIINQVERISKDLADFLRLGFDPAYDERPPT